MPTWRWSLISDDEDAELRVSFEGKGGYSYSYVGAQSLLIPRTQATVVLGWVREASAIDELESVVLLRVRPRARAPA